MSGDPESRALEAVLKLTALDERTAQLRASLERIEQKLEVLVDRLAKVEATCRRLEPTAGEHSHDQPLSRSFLTTASEE